MSIFWKKMAGALLFIKEDRQNYNLSITKDRAGQVRKGKEGNNKRQTTSKRFRWVDFSLKFP
jgi:hypothetical protein